MSRRTGKCSDGKAACFPYSSQKSEQVKIMPRSARDFSMARVSDAQVLCEVREVRRCRSVLGDQRTQMTRAGNRGGCKRICGFAASARRVRELE